MDEHNNNVKINLVKQGCPAATITYNKEASFLECMAAKELQSYIEKLTGVQLEMAEPFDTGCSKTETVIRIGLKTDINDKEGMQKSGSFTINCECDSDFWVISIDGFDPVGTLYGTYAFIEKLGVTFILTGDLLPPKTSDLAVEPINEIQQPAFSRRGFIHQHVDLHSTILDKEDWFSLLDQMVKMRLNFIVFYQLHGLPWIDYTYRGEKNLVGDINSRESGYHQLKMSVPDVSTARVKIGKEHFNNRKYMAPLAFQDSPTQQETKCRFIKALHEVFAYAKKRGIFIGLAIDVATAVPNFARYARKVGPRPHDGVMGTYLSPTDPAALEIGERLIDAVVETYPEIDQLFLFCTEDYPFDKLPDSMALYEKMRPHFKVATDILEKQWQSLCKLMATRGENDSVYWSLSPQEMVDCDIAMGEMVKKLLDITRTRYPRLKMGMGFFLSIVKVLESTFPSFTSILL